MARRRRTTSTRRRSTTTRRRSTSGRHRTKAEISRKLSLAARRRPRRADGTFK